MIFSRSRDLTVRMGEFETFKFGGFVSLSHHDYGLSDEELAALSDQARTELSQRIRNDVVEMLAAELIDDIKDAAELTEDRKSFILRSFRVEKAPVSPRSPVKPPPRIIRRIGTL